MAIIPVTQADELLREAVAEDLIVSITGTGLVVTATVPKGVRWRVSHISVGQVDGTWTHSNLRVTDPIGGSDFVLKLYTATAGTELYEPTAGPMVLDELWQFKVNIAAQSVTGDMIFSIYRTQESAF